MKTYALVVTGALAVATVLPCNQAASADANAAIMRYLGEPVPVPADLPPVYSADALLAAFKSVCQGRAVQVRNVAVDTTEFPFVVHGVLDGRQELRPMDVELKAGGYAYSGSVTGRIQDGATYFALNMVPSSAYPREQVEAIHRRLMVRLQMLASTWRETAGPP